MKLMRKRRGEHPPVHVDATPMACEHVTLIPTWDRAEDIGHDDRVAMYRCEVCGGQFTLGEAAELRATEAARLRRRMAS